MKWRNPAGKERDSGLKDSWAAQNKEDLTDRERDEENRLLYVAMTRAEEHLILSYSRGKNKPQNWARLLERRFSLGDYSPATEPRRTEVNGIDVSILVTDSDPPARRHSARDRRDAEIQRVAKPANEDQYETTATVTSLAVFGSCPRKYYIQRSLGWNTGRFRAFDPEEIAASDDDNSDDEDNLSASRIGSAAHEILAGLTPSDDSPEARRLADVFSESGLGARAAASQRAEREWAFVADLDGTIVRGSIDLWFEESGALHIVDYKTDDVTAESAVAKAQEYAPQTALYAIALERAQGKRPKSAYLHFLRPNVIVEIPLDDQAIESARKLIADLRQAQNELRFDLREGAHCRTCQFYRTLCPAGRPDAILDMAREPDT
jgi:ATP-dependent exoDNAse (exonuclease V) beta subunit